MDVALAEVRKFRGGTSDSVGGITLTSEGLLRSGQVE